MIGLALGSACGAAPLLLAAIRNRLALGVIVFLICALTGAGWGIGASAPLAGLGLGLILLLKPARSTL